MFFKFYFQLVTVDIQDTNNNKPIFLPTDDISFTIIPPLPPGFYITGCNDQIVVRDIDLTTTAIKFEMDDNEYFEIVFDDMSTIPESKNFLAFIRTKTFVRSLPNPMQLQISATVSIRNLLVGNYFSNESFKSMSKYKYLYNYNNITSGCRSNGRSSAHNLRKVNN